MSDQKKDCSACLPGVVCSVTNCKYHGGADRCQATHISVRSETATQKAETFCGTFEARHTTAAL